MAAPAHDVDTQIAAIIRAWRRAGVFLTAVVALVAAGAIVILWLIVAAQQTQLAAATAALAADTAQLQRVEAAACAYDASLAPLSDLRSLPLTVLIADARRSFVTRRCPGKLPPASKSFLRYARYYRLPPGP